MGCGGTWERGWLLGGRTGARLCEGRGRRVSEELGQEGKEGRGEVWCEWRPTMWWAVNGRAADRAAAADWAAEGKPGCDTSRREGRGVEGVLAVCEYGERVLVRTTDAMSCVNYLVVCWFLGCEWMREE